MAYVDALEKFENLERAHAKDAPASKWSIWPGYGYSLSAASAGTLILAALRGEKSGDRSYALVFGPDVAGCSSVKDTRRQFTVDGRRLVFAGTCLDDRTVYQPVRGADGLWFDGRVEKGGKLVVDTKDETVTFDLSRIPVIKANFALDAMAAAVRNDSAPSK